MKQYYRINKLGKKNTTARRMKRITLMLLNIYTIDWKSYYSLIYSPVLKVKQPAWAFGMLLNLVTKYYSLSTYLPPNKKKWFSRRIKQFITWKLAELQKWLKKAKMIIHNDHLKRKKSLKTIDPQQKLSRYVHKIIRGIDIQIIAKQQPTSMTNFFNNIIDNRQESEYKKQWI